jgi:O-acetyl-ADP-ribose deacetylase (regulator of RNase III)
MIDTVVGNMLTDYTQLENTDVIYMVHGCNSKGVMASGIAKEVRARYPEAYNLYHAEHQRYGLKMGSFTIAPVRTGDDGPKVIIINAITQKNYGRDPNTVYVDYDAIRVAFESLNNLIAEHHAHELDRVTVNFPLIGCGLANGDWKIVSNIIDTSLTACNKFLWVLP